MNTSHFSHLPISTPLSGGSRYRPPFARRSVGPAIARNENVQEDVQRGVLHQVAPNTTAPTTCSVLLNGTLVPKSGFSLKPGTGPFYQAGTHPSGPYYNDPATNTGGSLVVVNTRSMTAEILQGTGTFIPDSSAWAIVGGHVHTGGVDPFTGNPLPGLVDINNHTSGQLSLTRLGMNPGYNPTLSVSTSAPTYIGVTGSGSYDAVQPFTLTMPSGYTGWLADLRLFAQPTNGGTFNAAIAIPKGALSPQATGVYTGLFGGLVAHQAYDLFVAYLSGSGLSTPLYLGTTSTNPMYVGQGKQAAMPGTVQSPTGTLPTPNIAIDSAVYAAAPFSGNPLVYGVNSSTVDFSLPFYADDFGTTDNLWLAEVQLIASIHGQNKWQQVGLVAPVAASSLLGHYIGVWAGLGASNTYDIAVRYIDFVGNTSNILSLGTYSVPAATVAASQLPSMPSGTTVSASTTMPIPAANYNTGGTQPSVVVPITLTISDTNWSKWLQTISILVKQMPTGTTTVDSDTNPTNFLRVLNIPAAAYVSNPLIVQIPLGASGNAYEISVQLLDMSRSNVATSAPFALTSPQLLNGPGTIAGLDNSNLVADSDMSAVNGSAGPTTYGKSTYWTYTSSSAFGVLTPGGGDTSAVNHLGVSTGASTFSSIAAYSEPINVVPGQLYCATVTWATSNVVSGQFMMGLVSVADKTALSGNPSTQYQSKVLLVGTSGGASGVSSLTYQVPSSGGPTQVVLCCWAINVKANFLWMKPQVEPGGVYSGYKSGPNLLVTGNSSYGSSSTQNQAVIRSDGTADPTKLNPAYGSAPHGAMSSSVKSIVSDDGAGVGKFTIPSATGYVLGNLPLPNNAVQVTDVITSGSGGRGALAVAPPGGVNGNLPFINHAAPVTGALTSTMNADGSWIGNNQGTTRALIDGAITRRKSTGGTVNFGQGIRNALFNPTFYNNVNGWGITNAAFSSGGSSLMLGDPNYQRFTMLCTNVTNYPSLIQVLPNYTFPQNTNIVYSGVIDIVGITTGGVVYDIIAYSGSNATGTNLGTVCAGSLFSTGYNQYFEITGVVPTGTVSCVVRWYYAGWTSGANHIEAYLYKPQVEYGTVATPWSDDAGTAITAYGFGPVQDSTGSYMMPHQISMKHLYGSDGSSTGALVDSSNLFLYNNHPTVFKNAVDNTGKLRYDMMAGVQGTMPWANHDLTFKNAVDSTGKLRYDQMAGVQGNLPWTNHSSIFTTAIDGTGKLRYDQLPGVLGYLPRANHNTDFQNSINTGGGIAFGYGSHTGNLPIANHDQRVNDNVTGYRVNLVPDSDMLFQTTYWQGGSTQGTVTLAQPPGGYWGRNTYYITTGATPATRNFTLSNVSGTPAIGPGTISVSPNIGYTLSAFMDMNTSTAGSFCIVLMNAATNTEITRLTQSSGISRISSPFTMPAGVTTVYFLVQTNITSANTAVYFGQIQLEIGATATSYKSTPIQPTTGYYERGAHHPDFRNTVNTGGGIDFAYANHINKTFANIGGTVNLPTQVTGAIPFNNQSLQVTNVIDSSSTLDVSKARSGTNLPYNAHDTNFRNAVDNTGKLRYDVMAGVVGNLPLSNHAQTIQNKVGLHITTTGSMPYVDGSYNLVFSNGYTYVWRPDGTYTYINPVTVTMGTGYGGVFVGWNTNGGALSLLAISYSATGAAGTGYAATLASTSYELIGGYSVGKFSPFWDDANISNAAQNVITSNNDGTGYLNVDRAHPSKVMPLVNHDSTVKTAAIRANTAINGSNFVTQVALNLASTSNTGGNTIPASTALNGLGSVAPIRTDVVFHAQTNAVANGVATTMWYWIDDGSDGTGATIYRADGGTAISTSYHGQSGGSGNAWGSLSCVGGDKVYFLVYYSLSTNDWIVSYQKNAPFIPGATINSTKDGICPFLSSGSGTTHTGGSTGTAKTFQSTSS